MNSLPDWSLRFIVFSQSHFGALQLSRLSDFGKSCVQVPGPSDSPPVACPHQSLLQSSATTATTPLHLGQHTKGKSVRLNHLHRLKHLQMSHLKTAHDTSWSPQPQTAAQLQQVAHDLDANAQWLEVLTPSSVPQLGPDAVPAVPSSPLASTSPSDAPHSHGHAATYAKRGLRGGLLDNYDQSHAVIAHAAPTPTSGSRDAHVDEHSALVGQVQPATPLHDRLQPAVGILSPHPVQTQPLSDAHPSGRRSHSPSKHPAGSQHAAVSPRQMIGKHQQGSSDESDQMTFAEAAGIRRRPDDMSWPAYGALQEGRQVRLLDRNSPIPRRSRTKPGLRRAASRESSRSSLRRLHLHEASPLSAERTDTGSCDDQHGCQKVDGVPVADIRTPRQRSSRRVRDVQSSDDDSSCMLDRLLTAWNQGTPESGFEAPHGSQNLGSQDTISSQPDGMSDRKAQRHVNKASRKAERNLCRRILSLQQAADSTAEAAGKQAADLEGMSCLLDGASEYPVAQAEGLPDGLSWSTTPDEVAADQNNACQADRPVPKNERQQKAAAHMQAVSSTPSAAAADPLLAGFWDTWQEAAKEPDATCRQGHCSSSHALQIPTHSRSLSDALEMPTHSRSLSDALKIPTHSRSVSDERQRQPFESPQSAAIQIPDSRRHLHRQQQQEKHRKHAPSRDQHGHGKAHTSLHWETSPDGHRQRMSSRALKHPAAAAAASRLVNEAAEDPLDALLQTYPGLDPVVADLILQVKLALYTLYCKRHGRLLQNQRMLNPAHSAITSLSIGSSIHECKYLNAWAAG